MMSSEINHTRIKVKVVIAGMSYITDYKKIHLGLISLELQKDLNPVLSTKI